MFKSCLDLLIFIWITNIENNFWRIKKTGKWVRLDDFHQIFVANSGVDFDKNFSFNRFLIAYIFRFLDKTLIRAWKNMTSFTILHERYKNMLIFTIFLAWFRDILKSYNNFKRLYQRCVSTGHWKCICFCKYLVTQLKINYD